MMKHLVYVGTYTQTTPGAAHRREGIFVYGMDALEGGLTLLSAAESGPNPSFLAFHPKRPFLYAVNELAEGGVSAFAINQASGELTRLNHQPTHGSAPCHLTCDPTGKWLLVANYGSGNLTVLPILPDGQIAPPTDLIQHRSLDEGARDAHAHSVTFDPGERFVLAADLGIDRILVYTLDGKSGRLLPNHPPGVKATYGAGPRHLAFHPNARVLYAANELNSTVTAYRWDGEKGLFAPIQTLSTLPKDFAGVNSVADIHLNAAGKFLYVSNRGHDSLAIFAADEQAGTLEPMGHISSGGQCPRNFALDPSGLFLLAANQNSNNLVIFRIQADTGQLTPTAQSVSIPQPVCVKIIELSSLKEE
jgi:6-phosphogluconolactonase